MKRPELLLLFLAPLLLACPGPEVVEDAGPDAGPPPPPPVDAGPLAELRINELMSQNELAFLDVETGDFDDWIELYNAGETALDLDGFALSDDPAAPEAFVFGAQTLAPGAFLIVFADNQPAQGPLHAPFRLSRDGERLSLRDPDGRLVDQVDFGELAVDQSAGRSPDGAGDFTVLRAPTPGSANLPSVVRDDVPAVSDVVVNELLALNTSGLVDGQGEFVDWVELYNGGAGFQDLAHHHLSDSISAPFLFTFPENSLIEPGGYLVVILDGQPSSELIELHAGFGLATNGDRIALHAPDGAVLDFHGFGPQTADVSLARTPDGVGEFNPSTPTPGAANP